MGEETRPRWLERVFLLVEQLMLENKLASEQKNLDFLVQNELLKTCFHLSFNILLKASHREIDSCQKMVFSKCSCRD